MTDYTILNKNEWQTSLCKCESESCFLSCIVPCHVYAKIKARTKSEYCVHLGIYIILYVFIQQLIYSNHYIIHNTCANNLVNTCISITDECNKYYMIIDDTQYSCIEENGFCVVDNYSCIKQSVSHKASVNLIIYTSLCYFILVCLHYSARDYIKSKQIIDESIFENIAGVVCFPTCGLAQEYREL
jgi:Cys-rich protein (TIGR01571 family)